LLRRPGIPAAGRVIVSSKRYSGVATRRAGKPSGVHSQKDIPPLPLASSAYFPPTTRPLGTEPPVGIISRWFPPSPSTPKDHATVEYPAEVQLEIVMLRLGSAVSTGIEAEDEVVPPVGSRVGYARGDKDCVPGPIVRIFTVSVVASWSASNISGIAIPARNPAGGATCLGVVYPARARVFPPKVAVQTAGVRRRRDSSR
jgi:hypothetical protein